MKLMTGILAVAMATMTGAAWGQNPDAIDNARSVAKSLQQIKTNETNAALGLSNTPTTPPDAKPAAGAPAKPATRQSTAAKPAAPTTPAPAAKPHDAFVAKKPAITKAASQNTAVTKAASQKPKAKPAP